MVPVDVLRPAASSQGAGRRSRAPRRRPGPPTGADTVRATATDSVQPISNALYASLGIVPRVPLLNLIGLPDRARGVRPPAVGHPARPVRGRSPAGAGAATATAAGGDRRRARSRAARRRASDRPPLPAAGGRGAAGCTTVPDGAPIGYGYAGEAGRVGPIAVARRGPARPGPRPPAAAVVSRAARSPCGCRGVPIAAVVAALRAGLRLDQFPILLCWDRPFADFARYLPISPGLL